MKEQEIWNEIEQERNPSPDLRGFNGRFDPKPFFAVTLGTGETIEFFIGECHSCRRIILTSVLDAECRRTCELCSQEFRERHESKQKRHAVQLPD